MTRGMVISGGFGDVLVREKHDRPIEIGELLIAETPSGSVLLKVFDLVFGSQLSQQHVELMSGLKLEHDTTLDFLEPNLRSYTLARVKPLITITNGTAKLSKTLPPFLTPVRDVTPHDLGFLTQPAHPLTIGSLRSGSTRLDVPVVLDGVNALTHHILIPATTGKGKSNLTSVMLWNATGQDWCGLLVLDPHDEYIGRNGLGLKDHPCKDRVVYYSRQPLPGGRTLAFNLSLLRPAHFSGVLWLSDPQRDCIHSAHRAFGPDWIQAILTGQAIPGNFGEGTLAVVKRRLSLVLDIDAGEHGLSCHGLFHTTAGATTPHDIVSALEQGCTVVVDTSSTDGSQEILIGSILASEILRRYKHHLSTGEIRHKPAIGILLEEAPRVLGKDVLEEGPNIFSTIAREGRKFKIGLVAITQLPSLIPRDILANMNTKIILGVDMKPERQAIIDSAAHDLSDDDRAIASLDTGEAIISSTFTPFAIPAKIPLFSEYVKENTLPPLGNRTGFAGVGAPLGNPRKA